MSDCGGVPVSLLRMHVEGPLGVGKTTVIGVLGPEHFNSPDDGIGKGRFASCSGAAVVIKVPEPMRCWRSTFCDLIRTNCRVEELVALSKADQRITQNSPQETLEAGEKLASVPEIARETVLALQMQFADPYLLLHERLRSNYGFLRFPGTTRSPDAVVIFDRHSVSSTVCFPAARALKGDCDVSCFLSAMIKTPMEPPGCNLVILELSDEGQHIRYLTKRNREGENAERILLSALRTVYRMLSATIEYAKYRRRAMLCGGPRHIDEEEWAAVPWLTEERRRRLALGVKSLVPPLISSRNGNDFSFGPNDDQGPPSLKHTLLSLLKVPQLCDENSGALRCVYSWAAESFLDKISGMNVVALKMDGKTPEECAAELSSEVPFMATTRCSGDAIYCITRDVEGYLSDAI